MDPDRPRDPSSSSRLSLYRQMAGIQTSKFLPKYHNLTHMYFNLRRTKQVRQIRHRPVPSNRLRLKCAYKKTFSLDLFMAGCFFSLLCFFVVVCLFLLIGSQQQPCKRTSLHCWVCWRSPCSWIWLPLVTFCFSGTVFPATQRYRVVFFSPGTYMFSFLLAFSFWSWLSLNSMLNDFVTRTPNLESKKDQKDLQVCMCASSRMVPLPGEHGPLPPPSDSLTGDDKQ